MSDDCKELGRAFVAEPCGWQPSQDRIGGGWCDICQTPSKFDDEGNECQRNFVEIGPMSDRALHKLIHIHTKLNQNQRDDQELVGYIVRAMRALERLHGIK